MAVLADDFWEQFQETHVNGQQNDRAAGRCHRITALLASALPVSAWATLAIVEAGNCVALASSDGPDQALAGRSLVILAIENVKATRSGLAEYLGRNRSHASGQAARAVNGLRQGGATRPLSGGRPVGILLDWRRRWEERRAPEHDPIPVYKRQIDQIVNQKRRFLYTVFHTTGAPLNLSRYRLGADPPDAFFCQSHHPYNSRVTGRCDSCLDQISNPTIGFGAHREDRRDHRTLSNNILKIIENFSLTGHWNVTWGKDDSVFRVACSAGLGISRGYSADDAVCQRLGRINERRSFKRPVLVKGRGDNRLAGCVGHDRIPDKVIGVERHQVTVS